MSAAVFLALVHGLPNLRLSVLINGGPASSAGRGIQRAGSSELETIARQCDRASKLLAELFESAEDLPASGSIGAMHADIILLVATYRQQFDPGNLLPGNRAAQRQTIEMAAPHDVPIEHEIAEAVEDRLISIDLGSLDHMRHCASVDVALDPFPFSGSTTTLETLWMGVPVVTLPWETFSSRHSLAFLTVAGVEGCIAADQADYVERAVAWAADRQGLAELRRTLRSRMAAGPLCDGRKLAAALAGELRALTLPH